MLIKTGTAAAALCTLALLLTGCGSAGPAGIASAPPAAGLTVGQAPPRIGNQIQGGIQQAVNPESARSAPDGEAAPKQRATRGGDEAPESVKLTKSGQDRALLATAANRTTPDPCTLLTVTQAHAMTGQRVTGSHLALLGPSCVYTFAHSAQTITVAVESILWTPRAPGIRPTARMHVAGHTAYCHTRSPQALYAPVGLYRVLAITGPCVIDARLATAALPRLLGRARRG